MISIIIINGHDSVKYLQETVYSIEEKITELEYEIIIVNLKIKTEDETNKKLKVYYLDTDNPAKAKNFGVSKSTFDNLLFLKAGVVVKVNPASVDKRIFTFINYNTNFSRWYLASIRTQFYVNIFC